MASAKLTSKGQITVPAEIRIALGIRAGDRINFIETGKGKFAIVAANQPVQNLKGLVAKPRKAISIEEMKYRNV
jgi:AbrB family looped-hinge helix DNA binding protein